MAEGARQPGLGWHEPTVGMLPVLSTVSPSSLTTNVVIVDGDDVYIEL